MLGRVILKGRYGWKSVSATPMRGRVGFLMGIRGIEGKGHSTTNRRRLRIDGAIL